MHLPLGFSSSSPQTPELRVLGLEVGVLRVLWCPGSLELNKP